MTTTPFEDGIADATAGITDYVADGWPVVVLTALSLLGYKWFRRVVK